MASSEELPDTSVETPKPSVLQPEVDSAPFPIRPNLKAQDDTTPDLPPQMQAVRSHTADEIVRIMNKTPLFMTSLENEGEDGENIELEAIRALQYEGSPTENAHAFKEQGNEMVKVKKWKDAKEFYTQGLAVLSQKTQGQEKAADTGSEEAEMHKQAQVEEACLVNRALCNQELSLSHISTTIDCAAALRLNSRNVKAYYRSSLALLALDRIPEASDACTRGLAIDSENHALKSLAAKVKARDTRLAIVEKKKKEQVMHVQKEKMTLVTALKARNISLRKSAQSPDLEDASIHLSPDPLSPTSSVQFPLILLYPLHGQSDFIKAVPETDTITKHLEYIFPLPWDDRHEYEVANVELYMETTNGGLIKVGKNMSLLKVLGSGEVDIVDELVKVNVLIKSKARAWIEEMKQRSGK